MCVVEMLDEFKEIKVCEMVEDGEIVWVLASSDKLKEAKDKIVEEARCVVDILGEFKEIKVDVGEMVEKYDEE